MRILHIAEAFGGGVFEMARLQAEGAAAAGHDVAIAYGRRPETPADVRAAVGDSVELFATPWTERTLQAQVRALPVIDRLVRRWRPDVIHLQSSFAGVFGAIALERHGVPLAYTPHGYAFDMRSESRARRALFYGIERFVAHRVSVIGATSASEAHQARREAGARRVVVVENGIPELDAADRPEKPVRSTLRSTVVATGRLRPQRQPAACARILASVQDLANVRWVGGGDLESPEGSALRAVGVPVLGWLPRERAMAEVAAATVYLHWTAWDGLPLSVLEAMAYDVIVVASDIPANREVLGPEQVFADERSAIEFIRKVLGDPDLADELRASQRMRARHYSRARMVADWLAVYEGLREA